MMKVKPVIQKDLKDCGICCMQWLFIFYNGYVTLEKLREDTFTDKNGTNAYHIVNAFKKWGFDSLGILERDITKSELEFPLIAHLTLENGLEHFVVVKEVKNNIVYLMDPSVGNKKISLTIFNSLFTGHLILVKPRGKIIKMDKGLTINNLFLQILNQEKFLIMKIVMSSIIWTIIAIICSYYLKVGSNLLNENYKYFKWLILIFAIFTLLKILSLYIREYYENHLGNLIDVYLYPEFLHHIFYLPSNSIKTRSVGEIVTRIDELANIKSLFSEIFVSYLVNSLMILITVVILFIINKNLSFILFLFIVLYVLYGFLVSKSLYQRILENINYQTNFNSMIVEDITMLDSIKNLNINNIILEKIEKCLSKYLFNTYNFNKYFNLTNLGKDFLLELCFFLINSCGFWNIYQGNLSIIDLFTFNIILGYCIDPVRNIISLLPKYNFIKATFTKLTEFINIEEENIDDKGCYLDGDIVFANVYYSYNNYKSILKNLTLQIKQGDHVLLNGPSGAGKSTICKLIYKEYVSNEGEIYIGNQNIKDIDIGTIRNNILYVSQNEELFTGTIKENILIDREVEEQLFNDICQICCIEEIVAKKTLRFNSLLEPNSQNVSGGEKQRIILARGLLKKANIIILDEALSEVDFKLENKIIKNIKNYFNDKTIIYISHKNQTKSFSKIIDIGVQNGILQN